MKRHNYYTSLPDNDEVPLHFQTIELNGRHLLADGESLHELPGFERRRIEDGGAYDAALV